MNISIPIDMNERIGTEAPTRTVFERVMRMVYTPKTEWPLIAAEQGGFKELLFPYTLWVGLAPMAVATLVPTILFSAILVLTGGSQASLIFSLWHLTVGYVMELLILLALAKGCSLMAESWKASTSWLLWSRVFIYGATTHFLSGLFLWIPFLGQLFALACGIRSAMLIREGYLAILKVPAPQAKELIVE